MIKSTAIDPSVVDADGVYRKTRPGARLPHRRGGHRGDQERRHRRPGDVLVLMCRGPMGSGMEEIYQITSALKHLAFGKHVAVITDARFSGVSTGACIGHVTPEALAGGPLGKVRDGDPIEIVIDRGKLEGSVNLVVNGGSREEGARVLAARPLRDDLAPDPRLPDATRCGRRCRTPAAAPGAAACSTWKRSGSGCGEKDRLSDATKRSYSARVPIQNQRMPSFIAILTPGSGANSRGPESIRLLEVQRGWCRIGFQ